LQITRQLERVCISPPSGSHADRRFKGTVLLGYEARLEEEISSTGETALALAAARWATSAGAALLAAGAKKDGIPYDKMQGLIA